MDGGKWQSANVRGRERQGRRHRRDASRHQFRRDGAIALGLFLLPWVTALILVRSHHHVDVAAVIIPVSFGLLAGWLAWATYRGPKRSGPAVAGLSLADVADRLAAAEGKRWNDEAVIRRLNEPYPLPVSWAAADASLTDSWDSLVRLACSGAGWPPPPATGTWATDPDDLAGKDRELVDVLSRVPTGRLVVLGERGAGKTVLMVRLVLDLIAHRDPGGPVPFLASVASWNPAEQDLRDWLEAQLLINHAAFAKPPPADREEPTQVAALLASGLILPILDGLDESPEGVRGPAISRINAALRPGEQMIVTCRIQQYRDAVRPQDGVEATLRGAAAIQLRLLNAEAVRDYLCDDAAGPVMRARWAPVLDVLGTEAPAAQALVTPLMVGLARAIYNPDPDDLHEQVRDLPGPVELCDFADRSAVEAHLFDAFIPAAYRPSAKSRWTAAQAEKWLMFLARHLEHTIRSPDLAWWQLPVAGPRNVYGLTAGLESGLLVGLGTGLVTGFLAGLVSGVVGGLVSGVVVGLVALYVGRFVLGRFWGLTGLVAGLVAGVVVALVGGLSGGLVSGLVVALVVGLVAGLAGAHPGQGLNSLLGTLVGGYVEGGVFHGWGGIGKQPGYSATAASPRAMLARGRLAALYPVLTHGLVTGLVSGLVFGLTGRLVAGFVAGLLFGLSIGLEWSLFETDWPYYMLTRVWLAFHRHLPWSLMGFLADAHRRDVLRQAGAVYQFRHIELQHRLANRDASEQE
jgi:hypothetical protein